MADTKPMPEGGRGVLTRIRLRADGGMAGRDQSQQTHALLSGLVIEPRFGALVVNGLPGTLQLYQFDQDRHIAEVRAWCEHARVHARAHAHDLAWLALTWAASICADF